MTNFMVFPSTFLSHTHCNWCINIISCGIKNIMKETLLVMLISMPLNGEYFDVLINISYIIMAMCVINNAP